jgi:RNA polymerase sigma-70 factor (TIGR02943 family)
LSNTINPDSWVSEYGDYLYRFTLLRVSDSEQAKDLVQETFISALKSKDNFKGQSSVKTWLTAICKHKILDYYRKSNREVPISQLQKNLDEDNDITDSLFVKNGHWKTGEMANENLGELNLINDEKAKSIKECLDNLAPKYRRIFIAREIDEISTDDICTELKISSSNLWVILHRARLKMQKCLGHIMAD